MKLVPAVDGEVLGVVSGVNATVSQPERGCFEVISIARPSVVLCVSSSAREVARWPD